jgi:hypothetical protein
MGGGYDFLVFLKGTVVIRKRLREFEEINKRLREFEEIEISKQSCDCDCDCEQQTLKTFFWISSKNSASV